MMTRLPILLIPSVAMVLTPLHPGRLSISQSWAFSWQWSDIRGDVPQGGLIAVTGEHRIGEQWWFVYTDGLYRSTDGAKTLTRILDAKGRP